MADEYYDTPQCSHEFTYWREGNKTIGKCRNCGKQIDATKGRKEESR